MFSNICLVLAVITTASSADAKIELGVCVGFTVHGGTTVAFNGELTIIERGNVGMSPGTLITGNCDVTGSNKINSTPANQCASDRRVAYDSLQAAKCGTIRNELGGQKLIAGVYCDS